MSHEAKTHVLGVALVILALATTVQMTWNEHRQSECNEAFAQNLIARARWAAEDREALRELIVAVFTNQRDPAQMRAFLKWRRVTEANERARAAAPLPTLARCE